MKRTLRARVFGSVGAVALAVGITAGLTVGASAAPSDPRATEVPGNATTCAGVGFPGSIQVGASGSASASDPNVSGVVKTNAGTTNPGQGQELDVTLLNGSVVINAVVVKGGPNHNLYTNPAFLPPTLPPDQHYISPLVGSGNVPAISHWFVCYNFTEPPEAGSLVVVKAVLPPDGTPVSPLPPSYTATVTCQFEEDTPIVATVTFGAGGGVGVVSPAGSLDGLEVGTVCTVVEDTSTLDPAVEVTYDPTGADTEGVEIPDSEVGVSVQITNDFADVDILAEVVVTPPAPVAPAAVAASPAFTG